MKELVLKIAHVNWELIGPGNWKDIEWNVYNDLSVHIKKIYKSLTIGEDIKIEKSKLTQDDFDNIIRQIDLAKDNNVKVYACDGSAWEIIYYNGGKEIWKRELGYIYGIKPLEEVAKILNNLIEY